MDTETFAAYAGSCLFKYVWNSKKYEISDGGRGQAYFGYCPQIFPFLSYDPSPKLVVLDEVLLIPEIYL